VAKARTHANRVVTVTPPPDPENVPDTAEIPGGAGYDRFLARV
jgi:hypothetical protein